MPLSTYRAQRRGGKGRAGMATREEDVVTQIFVASTHTPVLFFSSRGMVYRMKVWRLPAATPQSVGKALVNLLPLTEGEVITSILPLPEDAEHLGRAGADVRHQERQRAPQQPRRFREHQSQRQDRHEARRGRPHRAGGDLHARRQRAADHGGTAAASASPSTTCACSRAATPTGVRGIRLDEGDEVISMAILRHVEATPGERAAYLKQALAVRRAQGAEVGGRRAGARRRGGGRRRQRRAHARSAMPSSARTSSSC